MAPAKSRQPLPQIIQEVSRLWRLGETAKAVETCEAAARDFPKRPRAWITLADAWLREGNPLKAQAALDTAHSLGGNADSALALQVRIHRAQKNSAGVISCCDALERTGANLKPGMLWHLCWAYWDQGDWRGLERAADALIHAQPTPRSASIKFEAVVLAEGLENLYEALAQRLEAEDAKDTLALGLLPIYRWVPPDDLLPAQLTKILNARWPHSPHVARISDYHDRQLKGMGTLCGHRQISGRKDSRAEDLDAVRENLSQYVEETEHPYRDLVPMLAQQVTDTDLTRPLVREDYQRDILISAPANRDLFVVLTSLDGSVGVPIETLDAYFSAAGNPAIYLKDFSRLFYCRGLRSTGPLLANAAEKLKRHISDLGGCDRLTVMGSSGAGHGAINLGLELGADRVVAFSPITNASLDFAQAIGEQRLSLLYKRLKLHAPPEMLDLRQRFAHHPHRPRIDVIYGAEHAVDKAHAQHIKDVEGVRLFALPDTRAHTTFAELMSAGLLPDILNPSFDGF